MRLFLRYILLLLAFTSFALIIAAFLLVSLERPVIYQVQFINSENAAALSSRNKNEDKVEVIRPVYVDAKTLSELAAPQKWLQMDKLQSIVNSINYNQSNLNHASLLKDNDFTAKDSNLFREPASEQSRKSTVTDKITQNGIVAQEKSNGIKNMLKKPHKYATEVDDLLLTVKTTKLFHQSRLQLIAQTWFTKAPNQTLIFSDAPYVDEETSLESQDAISKHVRVTDCPPSHQRQALCCKMSWEFDAFLESSAKWWCHFDDDNYVNVVALVDLLSQYDPRENWYLGRPSIRNPLQILNRDDVTQHIVFWFATGGAGFCISRSLALLMMPLAGGGKLVSIGDKIRLPDDVTIGYVIEHLLKQKLTVVERFHSHLENLEMLEVESLPYQVSLSYSLGAEPAETNVLSLPGLPQHVDPTRMLTLHCILYPDAEVCKQH